jgi:hypothetical protein
MALTQQERAALFLSKAGELENIGTAASHAAGDFFAVANNLSEGTAATKRTNLGLGTAAVLNLVASFVKIEVIAGGSAGNLTVSGIKTTDTLVSVLRLVGAATTMTNITDLTSEFTISATNTINNTSGTATTADKLLVVWIATS